jgi:hypothetical protein
MRIWVSLILFPMLLAIGLEAKASTIEDLCKTGSVEGTFQIDDINGSSYRLNLFCSHADHIEASLKKAKFPDRFQLSNSQIVRTGSEENLVLATFDLDPSAERSIGSNNVGVIVVLQLSALEKGKLVGHYREMNRPGSLQFTGHRLQSFVMYSQSGIPNWTDNQFTGTFEGTLPNMPKGGKVLLDLFVLANLERAILHFEGFSVTFYDGMSVPTSGVIEASTSVGKGESGAGALGQLRGKFLDANTIELLCIMPDLTEKKPVTFKRVLKSKIPPLQNLTPLDPSNI